MNALTTFPFSHDEDSPTMAIRVHQQDGAPWFVAKDICSVLGIQNIRQNVSRLDEDEKADVSLTYTSSNGVTQARNMTVVSESGLYTLILRCDDAIKEGTPAHKFRRWVTGTLLPEVRRTGTYALEKDSRYETASKLLQAGFKQEVILRNLFSPKTRAKPAPPKVELSLEEQWAEFYRVCTVESERDRPPATVAGTENYE